MKTITEVSVWTEVPELDGTPQTLVPSIEVRHIDLLEKVRLGQLGMSTVFSFVDM